MPGYSTSSIIAGTAREARVRGIQSHLGPIQMELGEVRPPPNPLMEQAKENLLPFGRFNSLKEFNEWIDHIEEKTHSQWSLDRIQHEWKIRLEFIQNWMETPESITT